MNTTNLFSELLVVGAGGVAWYTLLFILFLVLNLYYTSLQVALLFLLVYL